jgi:diguanylate cyclase (GGDEF)-like protein/PAS domain S-box-containing protein
MTVAPPPYEGHAVRATKLLIIEDDVSDAALLVQELTRSGVQCDHHRIEREADLIEALKEPWDAVLSDFKLPGWDGFAALRRVRRTVDDLPFIFVSGSVGEDVAVAAMRAGADDYVLKDNLRRLGPALTRELQTHRDRRRALETEHARQLTELRYGQVLETAADAIISIDARQIVQGFNRGAERTFGYRPEEVIGRPLEFLVPPRVRRKHRSKVERFLSGTVAGDYMDKHNEIVGLRRDGSEFPAQTSLSKVGLGGDIVATAILRDITVMRQSEERIRFLAHFDPLTRLPNRILFRERLEIAAIEARRKGRLVGVVVLDLDRFKQINDTRGHGAGDKVLKAVAARLSGTLRSGDTVARLGGDEFGLILADLASDLDAGPLADVIVNAVRYPLEGESESFHTTTSAGLTVFPADGEDPETLLANADLAMYRAKAAGGDRFEFYQAEMTTRERRRAELEADLAATLAAHRLSVQFQPQVEAESGTVVGLEALARWSHPGRGVVPPGEFIPIAEVSGLIVKLGEQILHASLAAAGRWVARSADHRLILAVNASGTELSSPEYPDRVLEQLTAVGFPPANLQIELTEEALAEDHRTVLLAMERLQQFGVTFAIDDFGTGYSNLSRLKHMPVSVLKLDRSLVAGLPDDVDDVAICSAVVVMAQRLGLQTVAEGVERAGQVEVLRSMGCDAIQGYAVSRPLWPDDMDAFLARH